MNLILLPNIYFVCQFEPGSNLPDWIYESDFYSITKSDTELSLVAVQNDSDLQGVKTERDWRILKIAGPLDFSLTGIIAAISDILLEKNIPIFVISTFETDYVMVKQNNLAGTINALKEKGYSISVI